MAFSWVLLDAVPIASWIGMGLAIVFGLLGFLARDVYTKVMERIKENEKDIIKVVDTVETESKRLDIEIRQFDNKLSELQINLLKSLHDIKDKFNDLRK